MPDLKDDLAALRIDQAPERGSRRWLTWLVVLLLLAGAGGGAWMWATRERPHQCRGRAGDRAGRRHAGVGAERVGLRDGAAPGDRVVEDHRARSSK